MAIRSDNGKEYVNAAIKKFCDNMGIYPEHSAPYMPQSNGAAENYNSKLQAKATALLVQSGMDPNMWSEAVKTAHYIRNRSPHSVTPGNQTPYGIFRNIIPSVSHFRVFGKPCYAVLPHHQRPKFGAKAVKGQFVGYELASEKYRVYYEDTNQVKVHRDVTFNEAALIGKQKAVHPPHIIREGELEHFDKLSDLPPKPQCPLASLGWISSAQVMMRTR